MNLGSEGKKGHPHKNLQPKKATMFVLQGLHEASQKVRKRKKHSCHGAREDARSTSISGHRACSVVAVF